MAAGQALLFKTFIGFLAVIGVGRKSQAWAGMDAWFVKVFSQMMTLQ
jgi:hypothetical protein